MDNTANQTEDKTVVSDTKTTNSQKTDSKKTESNSTANTSNNTNNSNNNSGNNSSTNTNSNVGTGKKEQNCRYETIPAWTEQVLVKDGWTEKVLIKDGWTENVQTCSKLGQESREVYVCWHCGYTSASSSDVANHTATCGPKECGPNGDEGCGASYHNDIEYYGEVKCLEYITESVYHEPEYQYIYHEPEYKKVEHPAEQKMVCD